MDVSSLANFLSSAKANVEKAVTSNLGDSHVILGNEAADLDSSVSAIVYSYYTATNISREEKENEGQQTFVFPVINCSREDFPLRTEVNYFLRSNGIRSESLICRDEIDLEGLQSGGKLKLTLVDHNVPSAADSHLSPSIIRVIDHHKREKQLDRRDTIESCGSCCTLVAQKVLCLFDREPLVCRLLLGTIIYDTVNLSPIAQIATPKDHQMVQELEECIARATGGSKPPRDEFHSSILRARSDVSHLSPDQLLKKDCKLLKTPSISVLIPAIPFLSRKFIDLPNAIDSLKNALTTNRCTVILLMGWEVPENPSNEMRRDCVIFSDSIHKVKQVQGPMADCKALGLQLVSQVSEPGAVFWIYDQKNVGLSRKFILPFLATHFEVKAQNLDVDISLDSLNANGELSPNKGGYSSNIPSISLGIGDPISQSGSSHSSAYNSCPYTPQNSQADSESGSIPIENYFLPSFNSRDMIEKIELKRGKLRGYERAETDELKPIYSYPFTPKNSYVDSSLEGYYMAERGGAGSQQQGAPGGSGGGGGILQAIDSEVLLRKLLEKRRNDSYNSNSNSNSSSKSQSMTKLNIVSEAEGGDTGFMFGGSGGASPGICSPGPYGRSTLNPNAALFSPKIPAEHHSTSSAQEPDDKWHE